MPKSAILGLFLPVLVQAALADDWPQFRGSSGSGVSTETKLPAKWSAENGVQWQVELPGRANSSPAVTARRVDLTTADDRDGLWVLSFDRATGKLLGKVQVGTGRLAATAEANLWVHRHNAATPTPAADDRHAYAFFGTGLLACVDPAGGEVVWSRDLARDYGAYDISFGMGSSPRLWGDLLFIACMTKGPSYVAALDKKTGKEVWKRDRKLPARDDGPDAYTSPLLFDGDGRSELIVSGSDHVNAYDPRSGRPLWQRDGLQVKSEFGRIIASPAAEGRVIVATSANPGGGLGHLLAVKAGGEGDLSRSPPLWTYRQSTPDSSTPVCYRDCVYMCSDKGVATCLDLATGKVYWQHRLGEGPYHAALVAGDGKVYFLSVAGACTVMQAGKQPRVIAENKLPGTFYATPALSDGTVYLRAYEGLYAITGATP